MREKSKKKTLAIVLAMLLICIVSVAGTIAYLQATTAPVVNTFTVGKLFGPNGGIELKEHEIASESNGVYTLDASKLVTSNIYDKVLPGVDIPKDPFVRITDLKQEAYLFIEVVNGLGNSGLSATIDSTKWTPLMENSMPVKGNNNGDIYMYAVNGGKIAPGTIDSLHIIANDKVIVSKNININDNVQGVQLVFYGYIVQSAGFNSALEAWNGTFK